MSKTVEFVYVVKYNADKAEGRGPMVLDSVWVPDREMVAKYIDSKPGEWTMELVPIFNSLEGKIEDEETRVRVDTLKKLTDEEIDALGLRDKFVV